MGSLKKYRGWMIAAVVIVALITLFCIGIDVSPPDKETIASWSQGEATFYGLAAVAFAIFLK